MISYETGFSASQNPISKITYPLDSTTCTEQDSLQGPDPRDDSPNRLTSQLRNSKDVFMLAKKKNTIVTSNILKKNTECTRERCTKLLTLTECHKS